MPLDLSGLGVEMTTPKTALAQASMTIYGLPGARKTTLAASAVDVEDLSPVLYLDLENSTAAVEEWYGDREDLAVVQLRDWTTSSRVLNRVLATTDVEYKTVVIDPINALADQLQLHMIHRVERKRQLLRQADLGKITPEHQRELDSLSSVKLQEATNNSLGEATTSLPDYGVLGTKLMEIISGYAAAPFFSIFVTHASEKLDERTKRAVMRPDIAGNVAARHLRQRPHVVAYSEMVSGGRDAEDEQRLWFSGTHGTTGDNIPFEAKARLGTRLGRGMKKPTMTKFWSKVHGKNGE